MTTIAERNERHISAASNPLMKTPILLCIALRSRINSSYRSVLEQRMRTTDADFSKFSPSTKHCCVPQSDVLLLHLTDFDFRSVFRNIFGRSPAETRPVTSPLPPPPRLFYLHSRHLWVGYSRQSNRLWQQPFAGPSHWALKRCPLHLEPELLGRHPLEVRSRREPSALRVKERFASAYPPRERSRSDGVTIRWAKGAGGARGRATPPSETLRAPRTQEPSSAPPCCQSGTARDARDETDAKRSVIHPRRARKADLLRHPRAGATSPSWLPRRSPPHALGLADIPRPHHSSPDTFFALSLPPLYRDSQAPAVCTPNPLCPARPVPSYPSRLEAGHTNRRTVGGVPPEANGMALRLAQLRLRVASVRPEPSSGDKRSDCHACGVSSPLASPGAGRPWRDDETSFPPAPVPGIALASKEMVCPVLRVSGGMLRSENRPRVPVPDA